jgi:hypothetical protein
LCINLLTMLTAYAMSGRVATIAYINEPTTGAYGTDFIWSPSEPGVGQSFRDSRRLAGSGVVANRALQGIGKFAASIAAKNDLLKFS